MIKFYKLNIILEYIRIILRLKYNLLEVIYHILYILS